jgi:hypothetical protein
MNMHTQREMILFLFRFFLSANQKRSKISALALVQLVPAKETYYSVKRDLL